MALETVGGRARRLGIALALALASGAAPAGAQEERSCAVAAIEGAPARIEVAGAWSALAVGPLPAAARTIATGPGARAEVRCDDGLVLTVGAGAEVALDALAGPAGPSRSVVLRLLQGIVGIDAPNRTWDTLEVRTPLAIASARSTAWLVEYAPATGAAVFVSSGAVAVTTTRGASVVLNGGQGVTIVPGVPRIPVLTWGEARRAGAGATLGFGWR